MNIFQKVKSSVVSGYNQTASIVSNQVTNIITQTQEFYKTEIVTSDSFPWDRPNDQKNLKTLREDILKLSSNKQELLECDSSSYQFDLQKRIPQINKILEVDQRLSKLRFDIVPKEIDEEDFWRNYFYLISKLMDSCNNKFEEEDALLLDQKQISDSEQQPEQIKQQFEEAPKFTIDNVDEEEQDMEIQL